MSLKLAELNRSNMYNKKLIRFVESILILPITMSTPVGNIAHNIVVPTPQIVLSQKLNIGSNGLFAFNPEEDQKINDLKDKANAIDAYFKSKNMPLEGKGQKMVEEAEKNNLDWRLIPAISVRESTGGKFACKKASFNPFGWGSCKIGFNSYDEAIEIVAKNLGGNNPNTAKYYAGKDTKGILDKYNPPSVVPNYTKQVLAIMDTIEENLNQKEIIEKV